MEHSTGIKLIIIWISTAIGTALHCGEEFLSVILQIPIETNYDFITKVVKDLLAIICFIAAITASYYSILEKRRNLQNKHKDND